MKTYVYSDLPRHSGGPTGQSEAVIAWTVWGLMFAAGLWFVGAYGLTMPYGDEWAWLPVVAGQEPASPAWLWSMHNEHRMVVPRLIYLGLGHLTGFDFRAGAWLNVLLLAGLSAAMMLAVRALRGRTSVYDAFFPLLLLHWAQCENVVWGFQLNFVTSIFLIGIILIVIARRSRVTVPSAVLVTACLVALGLCGLYGLAYLPALGCWLLFAGIMPNSAGEPAASKNQPALVRPLLVALGGVPFLVVGLYFIGFHSPHVGQPAIWASMRTSLQFLSSGIGPTAKEIWPVSGVLIVTALCYAIWQLITVVLRQPNERVRAAGLFCFLGGIGSLAIAIGVGRAFEGPKAGFMERYMTLAAPLLCLFYFQFTLYSSRARVHLQRTLCLLMFGLLAINVAKGMSYARSYDRLHTALQADMLAGIAPAELAIRHGEDLAFAPDELFAARLEMLRDARLGPYRNLVEPSNIRIRPLAPLVRCREPSRTICLLPNQLATQRFDLPAGAIVARIDVQLSRCRERRMAERLDWTLYRSSEVTHQERSAVAHGSIDLRGVGCQDYVTLAIVPGATAGSPSSVSNRNSFALELILPPDASPDSGVELPLYRSTTAHQALNVEGSPKTPSDLTLKGFVYFADYAR